MTKKVYPYVCQACKDAPRRGQYRRSWRWKTQRGFDNHRCYANEAPREPEVRQHQDRENGKQPFWLTGDRSPCPRCRAPIPYSGLRNPGLHFACPSCGGEVQWVRYQSREVETLKRICSLCGSPMVKREGKFGTFWGCSSYTKANPCKGKARLVSVPAVAWETELVAWEAGTGFDGSDPRKVARVEAWREREEARGGEWWRDA